MPKDTKTLGNNKARACESLGFVHKKRLCQRFDTTSFLLPYYIVIYSVKLITTSSSPPDYDHYTPNPERSNPPLETQTNGGYSRFSADA